MPRNVYAIGKMDYNGSGRRNCLATFEWELKETIKGYEFAMSGNVWNPRKTDIYMGGQCIDEILRHFPNDAKARRMAEIWREYHLNGMNSGSPAQRAFLDANPDPRRSYDAASAALKAAGLNPDPSYLHNGKPYRYGSAWLFREIPADIVAEIKSWEA